MLGHGPLHVNGKPLKLLGEGSFARAYYDPERPDVVYSVVQRDVNDKDLVVEARNALPDNPHLPRVEYVGRTQPLTRKVYRMPRYQVPPPEGSEADAQMETLFNCWTRAQAQLHEGMDMDTASQTELDGTVRCAYERLPVSVAEALDALTELSREHGARHMIDIDNYNVGADANGNLILLDVLAQYR